MTRQREPSHAPPALRFGASLAVALWLLAGACSPEAPEVHRSDGTWVGTITTDGNVTTVVNKSGSVWGGTATLVEEASIGVEAGASEYLLGAFGAVFTTEQNIYIADRQVRQLRFYDINGVYVGDIGQQGQGPGEYAELGPIGGDGQGRIFVHDYPGRRFVIFSESGESLGTFPAQEAMCCEYPMIAAPNGNLWARSRVRDVEDPPSDSALREFGPGGLTGETRWPVEPPFEPIRVAVPLPNGTTANLRFLGTPRSTWTVAPSGAIVTAASDRYRFEIQNSDGTVLVVEREGAAIPMPPEHAEWLRRLFTSGMRWEAAGPGPDYVWDGAEIPPQKLSFVSMIPSETGEIWFARPGPSEKLACDGDPIVVGYVAASERPCWRDRVILDVFASDGRYLGEVESPANIRTERGAFHIRGDQVVAVVEDEAGTIMVKRYQLVLPGEEAQ